MKQDKELVCVECKNTFIFTAGEQEFFASKGFTEPRRCQVCRKARKQKNDNGQPKL